MIYLPEKIYITTLTHTPIHCRQIIGLLLRDSPSLESLIQLQLIKRDEDQSGCPTLAHRLAFTALRFVTLYPDRQKEPLLSGIENLLLCKVDTTLYKSNTRAIIPHHIHMCLKSQGITCHELLCRRRVLPTKTPQTNKFQKLASSLASHEFNCLTAFTPCRMTQ